MNPFEISDDEDVDLSALNKTLSNGEEDDFRERTTSRETSIFLDTVEDTDEDYTNDSKYYSANSNM